MSASRVTGCPDTWTPFSGSVRWPTPRTELLARSVGDRDAISKASFEVLVARHGPMVQEFAADCYAARRTATTSSRRPSWSWLASRVRSAAASRSEAGCTALPGTPCSGSGRGPSEPARASGWDREAGHAADQRGGDQPGRPARAARRGVDRLPLTFRAPVVLCYLAGLTQDEAAARLRCPVGTVRSRLARARARLSSRLIQRGLTPAAVELASLAARRRRRSRRP